jgi:hypothetical protein
MNRGYRESIGLPTPTARHAGEDRFVRRQAIDRKRRQNGDKASTDPHQRVARRSAALDQSAQTAARQVQIGVMDQAAKPQSP